MSKRTTAFIAAAVMALSLAACGDTSGESKSDKSAVNSTAETTAAADNAEANRTPPPNLARLKALKLRRLRKRQALLA